MVVDGAQEGASATAIIAVLEDELAQFLELCGGIVNWWRYSRVTQESGRVHCGGVQRCLGLAHSCSSFA